ncbi:phosphatase 2C (PP2C)-like protein [Corchorus capsularis]|uniref:protein-serine/threonine phosphatase n=1 Tax=Corchorus capsularis TaxID=210143 RepID=A0A1R3IAW2_COCAP|nr:phosphatase 2C (PP2C)-like protein [Corchorus capsularis]
MMSYEIVVKGGFVNKKKIGIEDQLKEMPKKKQKVKEEEEEGSESTVTCTSHGLISVIGRRRVMEDAVTASVGEIEGYDFYAVYDGHGGAAVATTCRDRLHRLLEKEVHERTRRGKELDWEKVMTTCFAKMDEEVSGDGSDQQREAEDVVIRTMGSTAVVVLVGKQELVVANCGDSRAVLCRGGTAVALSRDHKPDRPDEMERVEAAGGRVVNWDGSRVLGILATSRSIGDQYLKPYVISKPEVSVIERTKADTFIVLASDGLWDVVSNEIACEVVKRYLDGQIKMRFPEGCSGGDRAAEAAAVLAELAMARGSTDNISVIVVELRR